MRPTETLYDEVLKVWGNPYKVAMVAYAELFRHDTYTAANADYPDHDFCIELGVLAGVMKDSTPEKFIAAFTDQILNKPQ